MVLRKEKVLLLSIVCILPLFTKPTRSKKVSVKIPTHLYLCPMATKSPLMQNYLRYCHNIKKFARGGAIPKKLHFIWVGGELPEKYKPFIKQWRALHPDWEFKLWTDKEVATFPWINKKAFDIATNPGMKSDIWRYEILYQYGGLYLDVDFFPLKAFDDLTDTLDFFLGLTKWGGAYNGLIASMPKHPILQALIDKLGEGVSEEHGFNEIINATGPVFLEKVLFSINNKYSNKPVVFFPHFYFYAIPYGDPLQIPDPPHKSQLKPFPLDRLYAIHYWGHSWVEKPIHP